MRRLSSKRRARFVGLAIDREGMIERVGRFRTVAFPLPMDLPDEPGARILNEVWLPAKIAEPLMQKIIVGQAEAMAMRDTPTASGH
jgi:hypothetical protein